MKSVHLLTSVSQFKNYIEKPNSKKDDIIFHFVSSATADIENYTGRKLRGRTYGSNGLDFEQRNGDGSDKLFTKQYPIISVTSLHDDTAMDFTSTTLKGSDEFLLWKDEGIIQLRHDAVNGSSFNTSHGNIKLVYTAGFDHFEVINEVNNKIYFNDGADQTVSITAGVYTANSLAGEVQTKMDAGSTDTIKVAYDFYESKFIIQTDGATLTLKWSSGTDNSRKSIGRTLGYEGVTDDSGSLSYDSDYSVLGIPGELEQACIELALRRFEESRYGSSRFDVQSLNVTGTHAGTTMYKGGAMPSSVKATLQPYIRRAF